MKTFSRAGRRLETRLLVHVSQGIWAPFTYVWNAEQNDAFLVANGVDIAGSDWRVPSAEQCEACHTAAAGRVLGLETRQLNRQVVRDGAVVDQLDWLAARGVFASPISDGERALHLAQPLSPTATLEESVRAYLHGNCSHCHRSGGPTPSPIDLRTWVAFEDSGLCRTGNPSSPLVPGDSDASPLIKRMRQSLWPPMPPLGVRKPDAAFIGALSQWTSELLDCSAP